jgi:hypothetical protein
MARLTGADAEVMVRKFKETCESNGYAFFEKGKLQPQHYRG